MYIDDLLETLVELARRRVRAGLVSERRLAALCGVSQPHINNVLKKTRALSPASAGRLMRALDVTAADLLWRSPAEIEPSVRAIPEVDSRIGSGRSANLALFRGFTPLPASLVAGLTDPVTVRLAPDLVLPAALAAGDLVLLDRNPAVRRNAREPHLWVVAEGAGLRVRYVKAVGGGLFIADEATRDDPGQWRSIRPQADILEIVRARIVWIGREMESAPERPVEPPGAGD